MDRLIRVSDIWNWLPVFRAVAETEHLREAAQRLRLAPSAVSRTIKQLEGTLGVELFVRDARSMTLTLAGQNLLPFARDAMRRVDDGLQRIRSDFPHEFRIASINLLAPMVNQLALPALTALGSTIPIQRTYDHARLEREILQGDLDCALTTHPPSSDQLCIIHLGRLRFSLYRSITGSEDSRQGDPRREDPLMVRLRVTAQNPLGDGWPLDAHDRVGAFVENIEAALELCEKGMVAILPHIVVDCVAQKTLQPIQELHTQDLFIVARCSPRREPCLQTLIDDISSHLNR